MNTIEEYLKLHATEEPERTAVIVKDEYTSYDKLWRLVRGFAEHLKTAHEFGGGRVAVKATQDLSFVITYLGTHLAGGIFVPIERGASDDKVRAILAETDASIYIAAKPLKEVATDALSGSISHVVPYIDIKTVQTLAEHQFVDDWNHFFPASSDSADIMFTSGTTGKMKGVEVTHSVLIATAENYTHGFHMDKHTVIAVPGPLSHVNPLRKVYTSIMNGGCVVILNGLLTLQPFFHALDEQGVNALCLPPASLRIIWKTTGDRLADYADRIDFVECSTSPLSENDKAVLRRQLPHSRLYNNYGLSECGAMVMYDFNERPDKGSGCVGKPAKNTHVIIMDDDGEEIKSSKDHPGLVANRSAINMKGYWRNPQKTAETIKNGYVLTNDVGYFDEEGFLFVSGRSSDTINVGGIKIEPADVEDVVLSYPDVEDCICVPAPDPLTGERLRLFVVTHTGELPDMSQFLAFLRERLDQTQIPSDIRIIDKIPRNFIGKSDRKAFKDGEVYHGK